MLPSFLTRLTRPFAVAPKPQPIGSGMALPPKTEKATLGAGCFWGVEHLFRKQFSPEKGLLDARVGYIGGNSDHPNYRSVCSGSTGHAEAVQLLYDPERLSYETLLEFFFRMHDPTTLNQQGGDKGTQYRSAIFTHGDEQEKKVKAIIEKVQKQWLKQDVLTQVVPAGEWWDAEDYHQLYLDKNPSGYACPAHYVRSYPPLENPKL